MIRVFSDEHGKVWFEVETIEQAIELSQALQIEADELARARDETQVNIDMGIRAAMGGYVGYVGSSRLDAAEAELELDEGDYYTCFVCDDTTAVPLSAELSMSSMGRITCGKVECRRHYDGRPSMPGVSFPRVRIETEAEVLSRLCELSA